MTRLGIGVGVHYVSIPDHPYYRQTYGWHAREFPHAACIGATTLSLPLSAGLSERDVADVVSAVRRALGVEKR
jgi:dTDP-4-amino-4,6-dideoxygalactose transaminase